MEYYKNDQPFQKVHPFNQSHESLLTQRPMQDSFLQNEDTDQDFGNKPNQIPASSLKMYNIQLPFLTNFHKQLHQIQQGIQQVLVALTNCQEGQKKRLPYNVLRSFEKNVKQIRNLKERVVEENKVYHQQVQNREKEKNYENGLFKQFLKQLGKKREQLKAYLNKVETRVRKLEDTGYAQFIQFDVVVPEMNTIRFSYSQKTLLTTLTNRNALIEKLIDEIKKRKQLIEKLKQKTNGMKLPIINDESQTLTSALSAFKIYKFFCNQCTVFPSKLRVKSKRERLQLELQTLRQSLKLNQEFAFKEKLKNGVINQDPGFTKTDHFIYLKQLKNEIKQKVEGRIFLFNQKCKKFRSKSAQRGKKKALELLQQSQNQ